METQQKQYIISGVIAFGEQVYPRETILADTIHLAILKYIHKHMQDYSIVMSRVVKACEDGDGLHILWKTELIDSKQMYGALIYTKEII